MLLCLSYLTESYVRLVRPYTCHCCSAQPVLGSLVGDAVTVGETAAKAATAAAGNAIVVTVNSLVGSSDSVTGSV